MHLTSLTVFFFFFFNDTATTEIYTLSLHDALPISIDSPTPRWIIEHMQDNLHDLAKAAHEYANEAHPVIDPPTRVEPDRKSTRLNSSHLVISYAVFCLKKKKHSNHAHSTPVRMKIL